MSDASSSSQWPASEAVLVSDFMSTAGSDRQALAAAVGPASPVDVGDHGQDDDAAGDQSFGGLGRADLGQAGLKNGDDQARPGTIETPSPGRPAGWCRR